MTSQESKKTALEKLAGKWGTVIGYSIVYGIAIYAISIIAVKALEGLGQLVSTIIEVPLSFGLIICMLKLFDNENTSIGEIFTEGFKNFGKAWSVAWFTFLKLIFPIIVFIISMIIIFVGIAGMGASTYISASSSSSVDTSAAGIALIGFLMMFISMIFLFIKSYKYKLAYYVASDNPEMTGKEAVNKSEELMTGKIGALIWLQISFIGWAFLACFTFGIGFIWLVPYMQFAEIAFYRGVAGAKNPTVKVEEYDDSNNSVE